MIWVRTSEAYRQRSLGLSTRGKHSIYQPRDPSETVLYQVIAEHLETFLATVAADPTAKGLPDYVREEFYAYLQCGILAHGFVRLGCDTCPHQSSLQRRKGDGASLQL